MPKCVLFDIDNTLLLKTPSIPQKIYQLALRFHPSLQPETVEEAYAATELWQGEQIRKENESGVRMPDDEYFENIVAVYERYF